MIYMQTKRTFVDAFYVSNKDVIIV